MAQSQPMESLYDQRMASLSRALKTLRGAQTADEAITLALDHVHQELEFEVAWLGLYDRIHHRLVTKGCHCPSHMRSIRTSLNLTSGDVLEQVIIQQRSLIVIDLQNEGRAGEWGQIAKQLSLQSAILYPIKRQDVCYGVLVLASTRWGLSPSLGERSHLSILLGSLAESLFHFQAADQRQITKQAEQPLLALLGKLEDTMELDNQLRLVVREIQRFVTPSRTRIFWFEPQGAYFWQRVPSLNQHHNAPSGGNGSLVLDDIRSLYQALSNNQLVVVGEIRGSLKTTVPERMLQYLQAQSLMLAPILYQGELLGFFSVEGSTPRIWQTAEKQFLMGIARLLSLMMPAATANETVRQAYVDQQITSGVVRGIYGDGDWHHTLQNCFKVLQDRLNIQQFYVLLFNSDRHGYDLCFQSQVSRVKSAPLFWPSLDDVDWQMLERSQSAVAIDNIRQDLKLMAWRSRLIDLGAEAILACNVAPGNLPEGLVIVADRQHRQWTVVERTLFEAVSRQIGVILHQWQLQRQVDQQQHVYDVIQWGLAALHRSSDLDQLEQMTLQHILHMLQASMVLLVTWLPGEASASVSRAMVQDSNAWVDEDATIPLNSDALLNWALQTDGILRLNSSELPDQGPGWFSTPHNSSMLATALRTAPQHLVSGMLIAVSGQNRQWSEYHLTILNLLTSQLAWSRRHLSLATMLTQQRQELEHLNWYKHHRIADLYKTLTKSLQGLIALVQQDKPFPSDQPQRLLEDLKVPMQDIEIILNNGWWQLQDAHQSMPLISLVNRLLERVTPVLEARQLWSQVHNDSRLILEGDIAKLELILYEIVIAACHRSPIGGRIDIWCRPLNGDWLEISITDSGRFQQSLLDEINKGETQDLLAPSQLDEPPGLHLSICQALITDLGGEIAFSFLDDGRTHSRILLPLTAYADISKAKKKALSLPDLQQNQGPT
jgi:GAF domain-containing protein